MTLTVCVTFEENELEQFIQLGLPFKLSDGGQHGDSNIIISNYKREMQLLLLEVFANSIHNRLNKKIFLSYAYFVTNYR